MSGLGRGNQGEILWMVMLLLVLLAMGMLALSSQQLQAIKTNQWHDLSIRTEYAVDSVLSRLMQSPSQLHQLTAPLGSVNLWPNSALAVWQKYPGAYHEITDWGAEIHTIIEGSTSKQTMIRLNTLAYHPMGGLYKKQCVISCEDTTCRRLSCIMWEGVTDGTSSK